MKKCFSVLALCFAAGLSACATEPQVPPYVGDAELSAYEIVPGDSLGIIFDLQVAEPGSIKRMYVRGLPENSLLAGTETELHLPRGQKTSYDTRIIVEKPAADGKYNLDLVIETTGKTFVAPLGMVAILDTPSRIIHAQFVPGSHAAEDCLVNTKLLELEYTVVDDNGASDFQAPALVPMSKEYQELVFYPHWERIGWLQGEQGIQLNRPTSEVESRELVTSSIRINCGVPSAQLYVSAVKGQDVSNVTGETTVIGSDPVRYYVE